jgi:hypothetical protein
LGECLSSDNKLLMVLSKSYFLKWTHVEIQTISTEPNTCFGNSFNE